MRLIRAILWIVGLAVTIIGAAICMQLESPQTGVYVVLSGLVISAIVDLIDDNFSFLRVGIRGVLIFASIALFLVWQQSQGPL